MDNQEQSKFEGWAILEIMGHQKEAGYVSTVYFGSACLFRVDVPELPEREVVTTAPEWEGDRMIPSGATVRKEAVQGRTEFVGPSAIFRMHPCSEDFCRKAIDAMQPRKITVLQMPPDRAIPERIPIAAICEECGCESGHEEWCPVEQQTT